MPIIPLSISFTSIPLLCYLILVPMNWEMGLPSSNEFLAMRRRGAAGLRRSSSQPNMKHNSLRALNIEPVHSRTVSRARTDPWIFEIRTLFLIYVFVHTHIYIYMYIYIYIFSFELL